MLNSSVRAYVAFPHIATDGANRPVPMDNSGDRALPEQPVGLGALHPHDREAVTMTRNQDQALWELYRKGLHRAADEAEAAWERGQRFVPDQRVPLDRQIAHLIDICNWETHPEPQPA
jgi:hypothetical protein